MKHLINIILLIVLPIVSFSQVKKDLNCYTIIIGKNASSDGSVMVGHNEDDFGESLVNWYKTEGKKYSLKDSITLLNGKKIKQNHKTNSYIRFQVTDQKFGDAYINRHSLTVCSNQTKSKEDTAAGNIGYFFRRIIAERARSARDAVLLGGKIIEELGYETSGRTYTFADKNEAWIFSVVKGKRWIACKVPDDHIAIIPNYYTFQEIDFSDTVNIIYSKDLVQYAIDRNWYDTSKTFNFRDVYGDVETNKSKGNIPRHLTGINYFSEIQYSENDSLPFSFKPKTKVKLEDIKNVLSNHLENTIYESLPANSNPHQNLIHPICYSTTRFSFIAQLRSDMPCQIGSLIWITPYNGCIFPYIPIYFGTDSIHSSINLDDINKSDEIHFNKTDNLLSLYPEHAYFAFDKYVQNIEKNYQGNILQAKDYKIKTESILKSNQKKFEKSVLQVFNAYPDDGIRLLTEYTNRNISDLINHVKKTNKH